MFRLARFAVSVALAAGCTSAEPKSSSETEPKLAAEAEQGVAAEQEGPPPRDRVDPLPREKFRVEVRSSPEFGGGDGWISSANVAGLDRAIKMARGSSADLHFTVALTAMGHDEGRMPNRMRLRLGELAANREPVQLAKLVEENIDIFQDLCGDPATVFVKVPTLPENERNPWIFDSCDLGRFGLITREQAVAADGGFALLAFGIHVALNRLGGPHPTEEALLKLMAGVPAELALGDGPKIEHRDIEAPSGQWLEFTSEEGGYTASFPEAPSKETIPMGDKTLIVDAGVEDESRFSVIYSDEAEAVRSTSDQRLATIVEWGITLEGGKILSQRKTEFAGRSAHAVEGEVPSGGELHHLEKRVFFVGRRLYQVMCTYPKDWTSDCQKFFDSFSLVDAARG